MSSAAASPLPSRLAAGCLLYLLLGAGLSALIDHWLGDTLLPALRPWPAIAAGLQFTLALGAAWTFLGSLRGDGTRARVLERARRGELPAQDGPVVISGTVRPAAGALRSPIGDLPCVAYLYRLWSETEVPGKVRRRETPHYWGYACRPFVIETGARTVRVLVVPRLAVEPRRCEEPADRQRAERWVADTPFETASGLAGAAGTAIAMTGVLLADGAEARGDWRCGPSAGTAAALHVEEAVIPVGATVTVAGTWSAERGAVVAASTARDAPVAMIVQGTVDDLLAQDPPLPPSPWQALLFALALGASGALLLVVGPWLPV